MNWLNKYRPKKKEDLMLPSDPAARKVIDRLFENGDCPSAGVLFHDTFADGGTGKTTLVDLLIKSLGRPVIELETTGNKVSELEEMEKQFEFWYGVDRDSSSIWGKAEKCIVVGHEISKSPKNYIDGLRKLMDKYSEDVLFLFTDNDYQKLSTNNKTVFKFQRVIPIDFDTVPRDDIKACVMKILEAEGKNTSKGRAALEAQLNNKKASIRGIITTLETIL